MLPLAVLLGAQRQGELQLSAQRQIEWQPRGLLFLLLLRSMPPRRLRWPRLLQLYRLHSWQERPDQAQAPAVPMRTAARVEE
jgi:hypothetical protein